MALPSLIIVCYCCLLVLFLGKYSFFQPASSSKIPQKRMKRKLLIPRKFISRFIGVIVEKEWKPEFFLVYHLKYNAHATRTLEVLTAYIFIVSNLSSHNFNLI